MPVSYDLSGRRAVVTGGARGIGREIAGLLVTSGARVTAWDLDPVELDGAASARVDVRDARAVAAAVDAVLSDGAVDILVNDAGYLGLLQEFDSHPADDWRTIVETNLIGTMQVTRAFLPNMRAAGRGRIVNMGSLAGKEGLSGLAAYSAASAGVIAFTKALGREVASAGIRVNCVAPGPIDTEMIRGLGEAVVEAMIGDSPMRRLGRPTEVAQMVVWLCTDASDFNTGAVFDMSGGRARY